jgi:Hsp33 protein
MYLSLLYTTVSMLCLASRCLSASRLAFQSRHAAARCSTRLSSSQAPDSFPSTDTTSLLESFKNTNNRRDQVISALSKDGGIKVTAATTRNLINDLMLQHSLTTTPTEALGRTVICGLLMANGIQDEQIVQITVNGKQKTTRVMLMYTFMILVADN